MDFSDFTTDFSLILDVLFVFIYFVFYNFISSFRQFYYAVSKFLDYGNILLLFLKKYFLYFLV